MKQQKREFNEFQTAYLKALAALETVINQIEISYTNNIQYQSAFNKLRNRKELTKKEFENVISIMSDIEAATENKFKKGEIINLLNKAENILIDNFKVEVLNSSFFDANKHAPIRELFGDKLEKIKSNITFRNKLVKIAMEYTWGELIPNY